MFEMVHPPQRDEPSRARVSLDPQPYIAQVEYRPRAWAASGAVVGGARSQVATLTLRDRSGGSVATARLVPGEASTDAGYTFTLSGVVPFSELVASSTPGIGVLFAAFAMVLAGSLMLYLTPPAELEVSEDGDGCTVRFRARGWGRARAGDAARVAGRVPRPDGQAHERGGGA